jgi:hypothetical protein
MFDLDSLSRMWKPDRELLLWQRKTWDERSRRSCVIDGVASQATGSIERSLRRMLGEINLVGLCC